MTMENFSHQSRGSSEESNNLSIEQLSPTEQQKRTASKPVTGRSSSVSPPSRFKPQDGIKKRRKPSPYETKIDFSPEEKQFVEIKRTMRTQKLMWTPQLHIIFLTALQELGLEAVPKQLHARMNVAGLTRENVASHLQKFRQRMKKKKYLAHQVQQLIVQEQLKAVAAIQNSKAAAALNNLSPESSDDSLFLEDYSPEVSPPVESYPSPSATTQLHEPQQPTAPSQSVPAEVDDSLFTMANTHEVYGERTYVYRQSVDFLNEQTTGNIQDNNSYHNLPYPSATSDVSETYYLQRDYDYEQMFPEMCPLEQQFNSTASHPATLVVEQSYNNSNYYPFNNNNNHQHLHYNMNPSCPVGYVPSAPRPTIAPMATMYNPYRASSPVDYYSRERSNHINTSNTNVNTNNNTNNNNTNNTNTNNNSPVASEWPGELYIS